MTPLQALQTATTTAAELLRWQARVGVVAPGFEADMIVTEANPLEDPRALQDVLLVISNGQVSANRLEMRKPGS
jgi:imidazolonepropionase-like amidohydrolase